MKANLEHFSSAQDMWNQILQDVLSVGLEVPSRNGMTKEIIGWSGVIVNPVNCFIVDERRKVSAGYAAAELLWYLFREDRVSFLTPYAPRYIRFAEENGRAFGAYGKRWKAPWADSTGQTVGEDFWKDQMGCVYRLLTNEPDTRQAVITHWRPTDVYEACRAEKRKDIPCTLSLQFLVRNGELRMKTTMRSNDAWLGVPYDLFCFCTIQVLMARALGLKVGPYIHSVMSMHLYQKDWAAAGQVVCARQEAPPSDETYLPTQEMARHMIQTYKSDDMAMILKAKEKMEEDLLPTVLPLQGDWVNDLLLSMHCKLVKMPYVASEIKRRDLRAGAMY
jgi:thymidylate synthase